MMVTVKRDSIVIRRALYGERVVAGVRCTRRAAIRWRRQTSITDRLKE